MGKNSVAYSFIKKDLQLILRDSFLLFMTFFLMIITIVMRFGLPWLNTYLCSKNILPCETITQSLQDFYPMIITWIACFQGASIIGTVFGFALLDEKDDNTIKAMLVVPVSFARQLLYRICFPILLATIIVIGQVLFIGQAVLPLWKLVLISIGASLVAPIVALFFASFAENKIQGLAYAKFVGLAGWIIILAWFVPEPWQWLFVFFPPFLIAKAYWMAYSGNALWLLVLFLGMVLQGGVLVWFINRFKKSVYK